MPKSRPQTNISLFPFLAVLVCTMGALILLLLVTTRRIRSQQQSLPELAAAQPDLNEVENLFDESLFGTTQSFTPDFEPPALLPDESTPQVVLQAPRTSDSPQERDQKQAQFDKTMLEIQQLDRQIGIVRHQIAQAETQLGVQAFESSEQDDLSTQLRALQERKSELETRQKNELQRLAKFAQELDEKSDLTGEIESVLQQRESSLISLRALVEASQQTEPAGRKKTILEFSNSSGTARNPVVVELDSDRCTFQPDGVGFSLAELAACPRKDNPLLSGIYASHQSRQAQFSTASPYVLLLVRPDSSRGFHAVRTRLMTAGIHFGYELIGHDQNVDTGRPNPVAAKDIKGAMLSTLRKYAEFAEYNAIASEMMNGSGSPQVQSPQKASARPEIRLLPNGGVAVGDETGAGDGRYFAGNQRLPNARPQIQEIPSSPMTGTPDAGNPWAESEQAVTAQLDAEKKKTSQSTPAETNEFLAAMLDQQAGTSNTDETFTHSGQPTKTEPSPEGSKSETNPFLAALIAEQAANGQNATADSGPFDQQAKTTASPEELRSEGDQFLKALLANQAANSQNTTEALPASEQESNPTTSPEEQLQKIDGLLNTFASEERSQNQQPTDWPQTEIAHSDSESRPVGSADSRVAPAIPRSTVIEDFLADAGKQKEDPAQPDPYLLQLLNSASSQQPLFDGEFAPLVPDAALDFDKVQVPDTELFGTIAPSVKTTPPPVKADDDTGRFDVPNSFAATKPEITSDNQWMNLLIQNSTPPATSQKAAVVLTDTLTAKPSSDVVPTLVVVRIGRNAIQVGNESPFIADGNLDQLAVATEQAIHEAAGVGLFSQMTVQPQIRYETEPGAEAFQRELKKRLELSGLATISETAGSPVRPLANPAEPLQINPQRRPDGGLSL